MSVRSIPSQEWSRVARRSIEERVADRDDRTMLAAFQRHGGLMSCESMTDALRCRDAQPLSTLARWIVSRSIVTLQAPGRMLVPLFQFTPRDWALRASVVRVLDELRDTFDDREMALWFATPNVWLDSRAPLACVGEGDHELCQAARADRFVARG